MRAKAGDVKSGEAEGVPVVGLCSFRRTIDQERLTKGFIKAKYKATDDTF